MRFAAAVPAVAAAFVVGTLANPINTSLKRVVKRQDQPVNRNVYVTKNDDECFLVPSKNHTLIRNSFGEGLTNTACYKRPYNDVQVTVPDDFWLTRQTDGSPGRVDEGRQVELAACIDPTKLPNLDPTDEGGVYSSFGGQDHLGVPDGATCLGYSFFVQVIQPVRGQLCMRCCEKFDDCNFLDLASQGCTAFIPGDYSKCGGSDSRPGTPDGRLSINVGVSIGAGSDNGNSGGDGVGIGIGIGIGN